MLHVLTVTACSSAKHLSLPPRPDNSDTGSTFYERVSAVDRIQREELAKKEILSGNIPPFLRSFTEISTSIVTADGKTIKAVYFVLPDYLSIGSQEDFARIPLTPMTAQLIADSLHCFLPTRKMVDDIYRAATVKLAPVPMYAIRDSAVTMYHHNLIVEGQRRLRKGLIAGIKKDVVITGKIPRDSSPNRVAIYGWHNLDGRPIQPLYTGHVDWYVDYSHGIRLVYRTIYVDRRPVDYIDVLKDETLRKLLCDEDDCDFYRYQTPISQN
ncbi:MAG: hypothetical protein M3Z54_08990 [Gemmatimonadota bacterium]|nr:hypothetical protein [Gemmatimonadota bacterium]